MVAASAPVSPAADGQAGADGGVKARHVRGKGAHASRRAQVLHRAPTPAYASTGGVRCRSKSHDVPVERLEHGLHEENDVDA